MSDGATSSRLERGRTERRRSRIGIRYLRDFIKCEHAPMHSRSLFAKERAHSGTLFSPDTCVVLQSHPAFSDSRFMPFKLMIFTEYLMTPPGFQTGI